MNRKPGRKERFVELWNSGAAVEDIAAELGIKPVTVQNYYYKYRHQGESLVQREDSRGYRRSKINDSELLSLRNSGMDGRDIGRLAGMDQGWVGNRIYTLKARGHNVVERRGGGHRKENVRRWENCPSCGSSIRHSKGYTAAGQRRYTCRQCNTTYTLGTTRHIATRLSLGGMWPEAIAAILDIKAGVVQKWLQELHSAK